ncbi:MAG: TolC family outer membrane protein [Hyphomonadaceae bacterium]|nr:TolC family outer membrane protein [Hyphomonadaceae bacterium]
MIRSLMIAGALAAYGAAFWASPAAAETLDEATTAAMASNPTLAAQRARLNAVREQLPQAWSEALPSLGVSASATSSSSDAGDSQDWSAGLSASQLLFAGGRVFASTRQARANIAGAVADYQGFAQGLILDVADAYAGVRQAQAILAAQETTVSNLTEQLRFSEAQFEAGLVTRTDTAQSRARLAQARSGLVQAQGSLSAAVEAYMRLVGHPPADLSPPPGATGLPASLTDALDVAGRESPLLLAAQAATQSADAAVAIARSNYLPNVDLTAGKGVSGEFHSQAPDFESESVGLRLSWSIFNGGLNMSRTRQQLALRSAANLDLAAAQRELREQVTTAWTGLESARSSVVSAREQVEASELAYRGIRLEQETGLRSTIDVLNQEQDLLTARLSLAQAERDLVVAERRLLATMGVLQPPASSAAQDDAAEDSLRGR